MIIEKLKTLGRWITSSFIFDHARLKTPTILQMEAVECGAAALGIILAYYKRYVSLEELRIACGISRDGSKASNMVKAARTYGLIAKGAEGEPEALREVKFPFIAFWKFNHFVVVEDIQSEAVYINDPATGRRSVPPSEFSKDFTGILLLMEPGPDFKSGGIKPSIFRSLKNRFLKSIKTIQFLILLSLALVIPGILIPGFTKIFIDDILIQGNYNWLILLFVGMFLTALFRALFDALEEYYLLRFHLKLMIIGSAEMLWQVFRLPLAFFEQRYVGDITERLGANERIATILSNDVSASVVSFITMIFFGIILFIYDWRLACIGLTSSLTGALVLYWSANRLRDTSRKLLQDRGKLEGIEISGLRLIETIKSSVLDNVFFKRWSGNHAKIIDTEQKLELYDLWVMILPHLVSGLSSVLILGVGSYRVMEGLITVGTLVAFQSLLMSFNEPIETLLDIGSQLQEIPGDISRIEDIMNQPVDPRYAISTFQPSEKKASAKISIEMKNVTFGYSRLESPLIENFNLTLRAGDQIALVGATGSGKSTIAKLVTGLYYPWQGTIDIEGYPLNELPPQKIAEFLALVDQDILLFEGSIRDNLTLWSPNIPLENLETAVKDACFYEVLLQRAKLYDAYVEEGGQNFSGGERQRLEIARALVRNPKILIMDEGTAALDAITEENVVNNLKARGHSLLLITHRLSTIRDSDEIIVLGSGKIIERGKHEELIQLKGKYAELIQEAL